MSKRDDQLDNVILAAVVASRTMLYAEPLEEGDTIEELDVTHGDEGRDWWTRYDSVEVKEKHVIAANALIAQYPLGYNDPAMTLGESMVWCKTWVLRATSREAKQLCN